MGKGRKQKSQRSQRKKAIQSAVSRGIAVETKKVKKKSVVEKGLSLEAFIEGENHIKALEERAREAEERARVAEARAKEAEERAREAEARAKEAEAKVKPRSTKALEKYIKKEEEAKKNYEVVKDILQSKQKKTEKNFEGLTDEEVLDAFEASLVNLIQNFAGSGSKLQIALQDTLQRFRELRADAKGDKIKTKKLVEEAKKNYMYIQAGIIDSDRAATVINNISMLSFNNILVDFNDINNDFEDYDFEDVDTVFDDLVSHRGYM